MLVASVSYTQNDVVEGKSNSVKISLKPEYERGLPPNLFVDLNFKDDNNNKILESSENGVLELNIFNKGSGSAQGLIVEVKDIVIDDEFVIENNKQEIYFIHPDKSRKVTFPIKAGFDVKSAEHKLSISVREQFGYDMDPAYLVLNTLEYQKPEIVFSGMEIVDQGEGTGAIKIDGQLQAGELVKAKLVIQNIGQNIAKNTTYKVESRDENIYIENGEGQLGDLGIGEVKEFWVSISPNKRVDKSDKLPVYLTVNDEIGRGSMDYFQLPLSLNQLPPQTNIKEVKADIDKLKQQVARFEYTSDKFKTNLGDIIDISLVSPSKTKRNKAVAVVIGVENYENIVPAPYAANDADIMKEYFKTRLGVDQVVVYKDDEISGFAFDDIFNPDIGELQKAVVKDETDVFVFYSGHGIPSKDGKNIYLFPSDGRVERLSDQGYNINTFYENLEKLEAKSITVFMDACFSGSSRSSESISEENIIAAKGINIKPVVLKPWEKNENFSVFNSSMANQTSLAFDPSLNGLFTYYLCVGMQGDADANSDKKITYGEMQDYLKANVENTSKKIRGLQTPTFNGNRDVILLEF